MVPIKAETAERMAIKASRVKRLVRRKMLASDRTAFLQSLVSELHRSGKRQRITPGQVLIQLQSPHWKIYAASDPVESLAALN